MTSLVEKVSYFIKKNKTNPAFDFYLTLLIGSFVFLFVGLPTLNSFLSQYSNNKLKLEYIKKQEQKILDLESLDQQIKQLASEVKFFEYIFPETLSNAQQVVISKFIDLTSKYNLQIVNLRFNLNENGFNNSELIYDDNVKLLNFNLILRGNRLNVLRFLTDLENNISIFSIANFQIASVNSESNSEENFNVNITGNFYYWSSI